MEYTGLANIGLSDSIRFYPNWPVKVQVIVDAKI